VASIGFNKRFIPAQFLRARFEPATTAWPPFKYLSKQDLTTTATSFTANEAALRTWSQMMTEGQSTWSRFDELFSDGIFG
jgi:hypothetical protein